MTAGMLIVTVVLLMCRLTASHQSSTASRPGKPTTRRASSWADTNRHMPFGLDGSGVLDSCNIDRVDTISPRQFEESYRGKKPLIYRAAHEADEWLECQHRTRKQAWEAPEYRAMPLVLYDVTGAAHVGKRVTTLGAVMDSLNFGEFNYSAPGDEVWSLFSPAGDHGAYSPRSPRAPAHTPTHLNWSCPVR
jgi:hypothetical protein